ncbi:growth/differentiation factor 10b isoform X1 [Gadus chalcogrammus]|uniref:growth/differentiation factor 10b isoform X1 n=2 Tax=Gadus chalcogrammus TaxID=1042646 RepID=UPI0024C4A7D6|nr:growth/differentiation factor 10b isoform X1 [Gadus chalcogrammus]
MANIRLHMLHFLFILEATVASEELGRTSRMVSGTQEDAEHLSISASYRDMVSINMFKLYDNYSKEPQREKDGNTVRSFKAVTGSSKNKEWYQFNLSSIAESEHILSATLHFLHKRPRLPRPLPCRRSRHPSCDHAHPPQHPHLLLHGTSRNAASATLLANITLLLRSPWKRGAWHVRDITAVLRQARASHQLLITAEVADSKRGTGRSLRESLMPPGTPYMLVYADDRAIDEPNSVAVSLQRYGSFPLGEEGARPAPDTASASASSAASPPAAPSSTASRTRREVPPPLSLLEQIQTNDLPEVHFNTLKNHELWQSTYFPPKAKAAGGKHGRKHGQQESSSSSSVGSSEGRGKVPEVLSFDDRTMKKARRKQWSEPRVCARRYLRVDFADIGWSEWVVAPKAFDAYYCSGTCGFPIPKVVRPSNHATIQSIVRAVGIVPGVPEPCCVPDKMSPLPVLFLDPSRNLVLKVYPAMSVDTCTCR